MLGVVAFLTQSLSHYLVLLAGLMVIRLAVVYKVSTLMEAESAESRADLLPEFEADEVPSHTQPNFVTSDADSDRVDFVQAREVLVTRA